jgi:hypothetical protein
VPGLTVKDEPLTDLKLQLFSVDDTGSSLTIKANAEKIYLICLRECRDRRGRLKA